LSDDKPWQDYETMYGLYVEQEKSCYEIAEEMPVTPRTINYWVNKLGIQTRSISEGVVAARRKKAYFNLRTYSEGYERIETDYRGERYILHLHRLLAVAEYGFDEVAQKHVHHKNGIRWDNRPDNLKLLTPSDHMSHHAKKKHEKGVFPQSRGKNG